LKPWVNFNEQTFTGHPQIQWVDPW